ncbi:MAG: putative bifunctional diguanylate cyclase/phosphodiesterase [Dehalococcoidia bacterium]
METRMAPSGHPIERPRPRVAGTGARLIPLWPVFVIGLCVALLAVYSLLRLQADNDRSHRAAMLLAQFEGAAARQNGLSWEAITRSETSSDFEEKMASRRVLASSILATLTEMDDDSGWATALADAYDRYMVEEQQALSLLRSGSADAALNVQEARVAPHFDALRSLVAEISLESSTNSAQMRRITGAGSVATMIAAALTIGFLLWRYERARGAVALGVAAQASLRASEEQFRSAFERSAIGVALIAPDGSFLQVNHALCTLLGYDEIDLRRRSIDDIAHRDDRAVDRRLMQQLIDDHRRTFEVEMRLRHRRGQVLWVMQSASLVREPSGAPMHFIAQFQDITERKQLQEEITYQAYHDALTGLPNRTYFVDRLKTALVHAGERGSAVAVLFLDLDGFKMVNDSLGHGAGDLQLQEVAHRLKGCLSPSVLVARFGGDEFTVLLEGITDAVDATAIAGRLIAALHPPFRIRSWEMRASASIGISLRQPAIGATSPDDLLREADIALYHAKAAGKGRFQVFDPGMSAIAVERMELATELQGAVAQGELMLHYQPEIDLLSERIVGVEALVRWNHPQRGTVYPGEFIPIAEETGLILSIGEWVLHDACRQAQVWQSLRPDGPPLVVSVNLSVRQLAETSLVDAVAHALQESGLDPQNLRLEITESVLMEDAEGSAATLQAIKALGVRLAIDDFGTGYSSLSYLRQFPVDSVKIDRSFAAGLTHDDATAAIVRSVTDLAHGLAMDVTAEGIEDADQLAMVRFLQCDRAQGYYVAPPLPPDEVAHLLSIESLASRLPVTVGRESHRDLPESHRPPASAGGRPPRPR